MSIVVSPETQHHDRYENLLESARKGCELCIEIEKGACKNLLKITYNFLERRCLAIRCGPGHCSSLVRQTRDESAKGISEFWFEWITHEADHKERSPAAALNIVSGRPIPTTPRSLESFETAKTWLRDCYRNHKTVCPSKRAALLPSRVIDVGSGNDRDIPHLHISKEGEMGNWATLSHCWGKISSHVTNVTNLDCRVISISIQELPPTLKDAIEVTRRMGLKYLWIDSICILQGSDYAAQADWLFESSRMRDYYKCCDFCIAADDASLDEDGFLCISRTQRVRVSISVSLARWRRVESCIIYLQADLNPGSEYPGRSRPILATRGWTLQEHLLSPRALHYRHEQIVWNCQFQKLSESNVNPEISWSSDRPRYGMDPKRFFLAPNHGEEYMYENFGPSNAQSFTKLRRWYSLVNEYAARALTFETDRLFALAALAREIETQSVFTYWAGIWAEDAHYGLLWRTPGPVNISAAYIAPSWSWASRDIGSYHDACNFGNYPAEAWNLDSSRFKANASSCEIITVDGIRNGRLLNAKLKLRTLCLPSEQWESSQDVAIARSNLDFPCWSRQKPILLSFDVQPPENSWCLFLPSPVSALQRKAKSVLHWVSSSIYTLVAK
ncbi:hypothetical protein BHYA_0002g00590 [Botrytis hyacinthi]|uniref:Heterokaryon incompatibility domain-containing protein n=1 Tax=Botrytis hyacinthi TaxID=278943 RepID=A0A4Z1H206_9HELO|nr:hypothetical protein BHYA_0002g00590 [Botrytis hyacinthi]